MPQSACADVRPDLHDKLPPVGRHHRAQLHLAAAAHGYADRPGARHNVRALSLYANLLLHSLNAPQIHMHAATLFGNCRLLCPPTGRALGCLVASLAKACEVAGQPAVRAPACSQAPCRTGLRCQQKAMPAAQQRHVCAHSDCGIPNALQVLVPRGRRQHIQSAVQLHVTARPRRAQGPGPQSVSAQGDLLLMSFTERTCCLNA